MRMVLTVISRRDAIRFANTRNTSSVVDKVGIANLIPKPWLSENGYIGVQAGITVRVVSTDTTAPPQVCSSPPHIDRQGWTIGYPLTGLPLVAHVSQAQNAQEGKRLADAARQELDPEQVRSFQRAMLGRDESGQDSPPMTQVL